MNTTEVIETRRSTRKFKDCPVERELIEKVVEAGRLAPSGGNSQTTHFLVITNRGILDDLAVKVRETFAGMEVTPGMYSSMVHSIEASKKGGYIFHYNAPVLIVTANRRDYGNNMADCSCALENMMLEANELDLGSCWINQLRWLREDEGILACLRGLGLKEDETVCGALALGRPYTADGLPNRKPLPRTGNPVTWVE